LGVEYFHTAAVELRSLRILDLQTVNQPWHDAWLSCGSGDTFQLSRARGVKIEPQTRSYLFHFSALATNKD